MKTWVHRLGSIRIAVVLLVFVLVALAAGTIVDSTRGMVAASRLVYDAAWFRILLAAYALNVLCSLIDLFPWGRQRIGFVLTHGSILLILGGALTTLVFKQEGRIALWEGETADAVSPGTRLGALEGAPPLTLPFKVRLDAFEIDYYQGTHQPAMFRSRVTVIDPARGTFPAIIEMNRELSHAGWRLYQSSYQQTAHGDQTILTASRDPGEPIVFAGFGLLVAGMITVLATRISQHLAGSRPVVPTTAARRRAVRAAGLLLGALALAAPAWCANLPDRDTLETLRLMPVQYDGRVMPLDTVARDSVRKATGSDRWSGADPVATALGWAFDPDGWADVAMVPIHAGLAETLGMPAGTRRLSFRQAVSTPALLSLVDQARAASEAEHALTPAQAEALKVEERLVAMDGFLRGQVLRVLPQPGAPADAPWSPPMTGHAPADLLALAAAKPAAVAFGGDSARLDAAMRREALYNRVRPSRVAWLILLPAALFAGLAWSRERRLWDWLAVAGLALGTAAMTWGIATRWQVAGRIPASNMYESLLFLGWGVGLAALLALLVLRNRLVTLNATAMSALTMMLTDLLPIDPFIHPMMPVLSGTPWLAIHVPIIMVAYAVLALGVVVAHMQIGVFIFTPARRETAWRMNDLLYWYMQVGAILLIAGILSGSVWAASSWGRYWGWDPKEVWSLVAFIAYLAILHGRFDRLIGPFGVAALSIVAFWTILMTYIGVNYVLATGLHSYGFGSTGVVRWMLIVAAAEALFLSLGWFSLNMQKRLRPAAPSPA
jgi:cytochrome c-type biogenesis protein CcsB